MLHICCSLIALGGYGKGHGIKREFVQKLVTHFGLAAVYCRHAILLRRRTVLPASERCGDADVAYRRTGILLAQVWLIGFPAKSTEDGFFLHNVPNHVGATGNAIAITVAGVNQRNQGCIGHGLQQPQTDHGRRHARGDHDVLAELAIAQVGYRIVRFAQ